MNLSETTINILFGVVIFLLLVFSIYMRIRRTSRSPMWRVVSILRNLNKNEKLVESFSFHHNIERFKMGGWKKYKDQVEFLPQEIRDALAEAFSLIQEINDRIDSAKRYKSNSYMAGIDVSKLKAPVSKGRQLLVAWVQENYQNPEYQTRRRRGLFGF